MPCDGRSTAFAFPNRVTINYDKGCFEVFLTAPHILIVGALGKG